MEPWMIILGIVALVVGIMIARYIANCFYEIACMKGFHDKCYFWLPFLFGIVGYLLVVALPDRKKENSTPSKPTKPLFSPQGTQKPVGRWACPDCGNVLPGDVIQCKCGYRRAKGNDTSDDRILRSAGNRFPGQHFDTQSNNQKSKQDFQRRGRSEFQKECAGNYAQQHKYTDGQNDSGRKMCSVFPHHFGIQNG